MSGSLWPLLAFAAVVVAIPFVLALVKRSPLGAGLGGHGPVRLVAQLPLAPNQRLVTVEVGAGSERRWLLLGATASGITLLHELAPQPLPPAAEGGFAAQLARRLAGDRDAR